MRKKVLIFYYFHRIENSFLFPRCFEMLVDQELILEVNLYGQAAVYFLQKILFNIHFPAKRQYTGIVVIHCCYTEDFKVEKIKLRCDSAGYRCTALFFSETRQNQNAVSSEKKKKTQMEHEKTVSGTSGTQKKRKSYTQEIWTPGSFCTQQQRHEFLLNFTPP